MILILTVVTSVSAKSSTSRDKGADNQLQKKMKEERKKKEEQGIEKNSSVCGRNRILLATPLNFWCTLRQKVRQILSDPISPTRSELLFLLCVLVPRIPSHAKQVHYRKLATRQLLIQASYKQTNNFCTFPYIKDYHVSKQHKSRQYDNFQTYKRHVPTQS